MPLLSEFTQEHQGYTVAVLSGCSFKTGNSRSPDTTTQTRAQSQTHWHIACTLTQRATMLIQTLTDRQADTRTACRTTGETRAYTHARAHTHTCRYCYAQAHTCNITSRRYAFGSKLTDLSIFSNFMQIHIDPAINFRTIACDRHIYLPFKFRLRPSAYVYKSS